jgi:hypothetical protein
MKHLLLTTIAAVLVVGCGKSQPDPKAEAMKANLLKGKWIEFGDTVTEIGRETLVFHENGTVDLLHGSGLKMTGKYEVAPPDSFSITYELPEHFFKTVSVKISKSGDELTAVFPPSGWSPPGVDSSTVGKFKREGN